MPDAKTLARSLVEAFGDPDAIGELLTDDVEWWITPTVGVLGSPSVGRDAVLTAMRTIFTELYADAEAEIHAVIGEGDLAAVRLTLRARALFAEGRAYENEYCVWVHRRDDQIDRVWEYLDVAWVGAQMASDPT